ncbi:MAG: hypothetical protein H6918_09910 [Sphingomonadaceae bacterium]|nr:hypothetical protein [Sphingomonadaceae bacterium]
MTRRTHYPALACIAVLLTACQPRVEGEGGKVMDGPTEAFAAIAEDEIIHFTGTEPFWGGEVTGTELRYTTPEDIEGQVITVERFAGNNGLGYSGELGGQPFRMAVTPGSCGDGMSDRTYPFVVTLQVRGEDRQGCAWTDKQPFEGDEAP